MNAESNDAAAVRVPPPLVYLAAVAAGVGLSSFVWPLPIELSRAFSVPLALMIAALGVVLAVAALRLFRATDQDPKPWSATPEIVQTGVYRFTRNPMYVAMALLQTAIGLGIGNLWILLLAPIACFVVQVTAIHQEEAYLESKFGDVYLDYKKSVRRWL